MFDRHSDLYFFSEIKLFVVSLLSIKQIDAKVKRYQDTEMRRNRTGDKARVHGQLTPFPAVGSFFCLLLIVHLTMFSLGKS